MLDRDGILLEKMPHREYLTSFSDYKPIHENWVGLRNIGNLGFDFVIVTNQPGVGTGQISESFLSEVHVRLVSELMNFGVNILAVYSCKHHWQDNCYCRKPKAGLLNQAILDFKIDRNYTLYIGDEDKDREAAINAKIGYQIVSDDHDDSKVFPNIAAAQEEILKAINKVG
jgi:D-glycero-D-manno-heptose 1,7-bisphosphate phosphatase